MEAIEFTETDWDKIYELAEEYYREHGLLISRIVNKIPVHFEEHLLRILSDKNSVYSHDIKRAE